MSDLIEQSCDHFWAHDHMGYAKKCIKCNKMVRMSFTSDSFIGRKIEEDNVTNIGNHLSPSTKIINQNHQQVIHNQKYSIHKNLSLVMGMVILHNSHIERRLRNEF